jgi:uncharacterized protein with HEPN domain
MSKRTINLLLDDILEAIKNIYSYTSGISFEEFIADKKTKDAVIRNFEIIGEAAGKLPEDFIMKNSHIDWPGVVGFRNVLVHDYFGIDYNIVWNIKKNHLHILEIEIRSLIDNIGK